MFTPKPVDAETLNPKPCPRARPVDARTDMPCLPACAPSFALTFLSPHFHQGTAAEAPAGPYCPGGGIAQMQSGCCPQYYFECPKCGTSVSVPVEDKDRDNYTAFCPHCSAHVTVMGRYASGDSATYTGNPDGYNTTVTPGDNNNTSNDRNNNNTGGSWFGGGNWFGGSDGGGTGGSDGGGWFGGGGDGGGGGGGGGDGGGGGGGDGGGS